MGCLMENVPSKMVNQETIYFYAYTGSVVNTLTVLQDNFSLMQVTTNNLALNETKSDGLGSFPSTYSQKFRS